MDKNKFDVKIEVEDGMPYLSITHNGWQWTSVRIETPQHEIPKIIAVLASYWETLSMTREMP